MLTICRDTSRYTANFLSSWCFSLEIVKLRLKEGGKFFIRTERSMSYLVYDEINIPKKNINVFYETQLSVASSSFFSVFPCRNLSDIRTHTR